MMNRMAYFITGLVIGTILTIAYEDEIDELRYKTNRCCKKTKRKFRQMKSYLE